MKQKFVLQWHITHKCNLRCSHCYQDDYNQDLSFDELKRIFQGYMEFLEVHNYRGHINFTGGEPFVYENIWKLLEMCEENGITFGILTNGTIITDEIVYRLKKFDELSFVQVSLDGTENTHESIRGKGTFGKTLGAIEMLRKAGIQTMVAFTCHKDNYRELSDLIRLVKKYKVDRFWVDRLIPMGEDCRQEMNMDRILSTEEYREVIRILTKERFKAEKNQFCNTTIHTNRALQFCEGSSEYYICSAGMNLMAVLANGDVMPCRRLPIIIGNVLENDLLTIYQKSEIISDLQKQAIPKECNSCLKADVCRGGAKCLSYAVFGDYNKKDYNCYYL